VEKFAVTGSNAGKRGKVPLAPWATALLAFAAVVPAAAQDAGPSPAEGVAAEARSEHKPPRLQIEASALPRLDAQDAGFQGPRVDVSLFPSRQGGMAAVLGVSGMGGQQPSGAPGLSPARPSVDVGLRFSHKLQNSNAIDVTAWRRMNGPEDAYSMIQMREPVYGARVEMKIKPAKFSAFGIDRGLLGFQLESGARISVKRKDGRPMVYYRTAF
jgi:hypothetical protein